MFPVNSTCLQSTSFLELFWEQQMETVTFDSNGKMLQWGRFCENEMAVCVLYYAIAKFFPSSNLSKSLTPLDADEGCRVAGDALVLPVHRQGGAKAVGKFLQISREVQMLSSLQRVVVGALAEEAPLLMFQH